MLGTALLVLSVLAVPAVYYLARPHIEASHLERETDPDWLDENAV